MRLILTFLLIFNIHFAVEAQIVIDAAWPDEKEAPKEIVKKAIPELEPEIKTPETENLEDEVEQVVLEKPSIDEINNPDLSEDLEEDDLFPTRRKSPPKNVVRRIDEKPIKESTQIVDEYPTRQKRKNTFSSKTKEGDLATTSTDKFPIQDKKPIVKRVKPVNPRYVATAANSKTPIKETPKRKVAQLSNIDKGYTLEGEDEDDGKFNYRGYTIENGMPEPEYIEPTAIKNPVLKDRRKYYYEKNVPITEIIDSIAVFKSERIMMTYHNGRKQKKYIICLGMEPSGAKRFEGDMKTPEGLYRINEREHRSSYHKNLNVSYPNDSDRLYASNFGKNAGGEIKIHGFPNNHRKDQEAEMLSKDWTMGCIAVSDQEITELFYWVKPNCPILILP